MSEEIFKRLEAKLDLIIDLLQDRVLTADEFALINEADRMVKSRNYQGFVRL
jgi:hypothetical protein